MIGRFLAAAGLALAATAAHAECKLSELASLDVTTMMMSPFVPVTLSGEKGLMLISFVSPVSFVGEDFADRHQLRHEPIPQKWWLSMGGHEIRERASVLLELGQSKGDVNMAIMPGKSEDPRVFGQIGLDVLNRFDVELDFGHDKINLFSPDHCKGQVVYWTHTAPVATADIELHNEHHFIVPMLLDGKPLRAQFSAFGTNGTIDGEIAQREFGVESGEDSHVFKTLGFEGLAIANPRLVIRKGSPCAAFKGPNSACHGQPELTLGTQELKHLRMFMAFEERKLYVTAADAK